MDFEVFQLNDEVRCGESNCCLLRTDFLISTDNIQYFSFVFELNAQLSFMFRIVIGIGLLSEEIKENFSIFFFVRIDFFFFTIS